MVDIKIFLGSSIVEFEHERMEISNHILRLNNQYHSRGVYFNLVICENLSGELAREGKQDEYNREIEDSQYVYILVGNRLGMYTREEFDVALRHFKETDSPRIHTFFMHDGQEAPVEDSVLEFMDYIDSELKHFYNEADSIDTVKLDMTLELIANPAVGGEMHIENGKAMLDGQEMFSVEGVSLYRNNESLQQAKDELARANEDFVRLRTAMLEDPANDEILTELMAVQAERTKLSEQVAQMEKAVLESCNLIRERGRIGVQLDWRERQALDLVSKGDLNAANAILRDSLWDKEFEQATSVGEAAVEKCREYISGKRLLISNLKAMGVTAKSEKEIIGLFETVCSSAEKWQVELDALCDYAEFLEAQRHYSASIEIAERCIKRYELASDVPLAELARVYAVAGTSYYFAHDYHRAIDRQKKAADLCEQLAAAEPALYERRLADAYNALATSYASIKKQEERESYLLKALQIGERLLEADRLGNAETVASTYNRLAVANNHMNRSDIAESYHLKAMELRQMLADRKPEKYEYLLAETYNNLGFLCKKQNRIEEAEQYYRKGIDIRRRISRENPSAYESKLALICSNYAVLLQEEGRLEEAEACIREAIEIRERWTKADSAAFAPGLAISLSRLGNILRDCGDETRFAEAEECYRRSLEIRYSRVEQEPAPNETSIAMTSTELAVLLAGEGRLEEAQALFEEALQLQRKYVQGEGTAEDRNLAYICRAYGAVLRDAGYAAEAERYFQEAAETYGMLAEKNPDAYAGLAETVHNELAEIARA